MAAARTEEKPSGVGAGERFRLGDAVLPTPPDLPSSSAVPSAAGNRRPPL